MFYTTKTAFIGKEKNTITTQNTKDKNATPHKKAACFEILCNADFFALESNGVADMMDFVSNEPDIDMNAGFQKIAITNTIEESFLYVYNLQPM